MKDEKSLSRRQFLKGAGAMSLLGVVGACGGSVLEELDPCDRDLIDGGARQIFCPQGVMETAEGLQAVVGADHICVTEGGVERCFPEIMRFGYGTDLHYAERASDNPAYPYGKQKLRDAIEHWNGADLDFVVMGGDYLDPDLGRDRQESLADLEEIEAVFDELDVPRHYVMGNHDLDCISKADFVAHSAMDELYYSFDSKGVHFVVLDANYEEPSDAAHYDSGKFHHHDIWINPSQLAWLGRDLQQNELPTVLFCHQRLAMESGGSVNNAADVRAILESSDQPLVAFTAHDHRNANLVVEGIHYVAMDAMVSDDPDRNAYAVVHVYEGNYIFVEGFGGQASYVRSIERG